MLNTPSTVSGTPSGLGMKVANFNTGEYKDSLWTLEKVENGYTMKDVNGKYVNIENQNVTLKDTPQTLTVTERGKGGFAVSYNGKYLNNWAQENNKVAAYASDDNAWSFYKASVGNVVTGKNPGTVTLVTEGTTYKITVTQDPETCEHTWGEWEVTTKATCTEEGEETRVCSRCQTTEMRKTEALGHQFGEWKVVKEPTETEDGYEERVCERCEVKETKVLSATGENDNNNNGGSDNNGDNNNGGSQNNGDNIGNGGIHNNGNTGNGGSHNNGNTGNSGNQNQKPVKTGDASEPLATALGMAGCLGVIIAILRRKSGK